MSPAKSPLRLQGSGNLPKAVELRWNDVKGPVLATVETNNGAFKTEATVPDVAPGTYYVVAVDPGSGSALSRTVLQVTPTPGSSPAAQVAPATPVESEDGRLVYRAVGHQDGMATGMKVLVFGSIALLFSFGGLALWSSTRRAPVARPTQSSDTDRI
jgi:hypothetical protein